MNRILRRLSRNRNPLLFLLCVIVVLVLQFVWLTRHATSRTFVNGDHQSEIREGPDRNPVVEKRNSPLVKGHDGIHLRTFADFARHQLDLVPFPNGDVDIEIAGSLREYNNEKHVPAIHRLFAQLEKPGVDVGQEEDVAVCLDSSASFTVDELNPLLIALSVDYKTTFGRAAVRRVTDSDALAACDVLVTGNAVQLPSKVTLGNAGRLKSDPQHGDLLAAEGYSLCFVPARHHIQIWARTPIGVLNAFRTILNLAEASNPFRSVVVAGCIVNDIPKLAWRGQHFDTARHFHDKETIFAILREMGKSKMNVFHWHLSDDQGWRLEMKSHPSLHLVGGRRGPPLNGKRFQKYSGLPYSEPKYHSQADIQAVIDYARCRGITVVPEIDLPAHAAALVAALETEGIKDFGVAIPTNVANDDCAPIPDNLKNFGAPNCMGGVFGMMLPTKRAVALMTEILGEVLDVFSNSPFVHLGGDEAEFIRDLTWKGAARADLVDGIGGDGHAAQAATSPGALQARVMQTLIDFVQKRNRTALVWDETVMELDPSWAPAAPTMAMLWRDDYVGVADIVKKFTLVRGEEEFLRRLPKLILTPKTRLYFDYLQHPLVTDNKFWPLQRPAPSAKHKAVTLKRAFQAHAVSQAHPVVFGVEGCLWTELLYNRSMVMYQLFPRMYAVADVGWTVRGLPGGSVNDLDDDFAIFAEMARRIDSFRRTHND
jgi:hexosaminidase